MQTNLTTTSSVSRPAGLSVDIPPPQYAPQFIAAESSSQSQKQIPPFPKRTVTDPLPPPSPFGYFPGRPVDETLNSSGHTPKSPNNVNFRREEGMSSAKSPPTLSPGGKKGRDMVRRRHSAELHKNVYTACGRHSDDWLFGGFTVAGVAKKIWNKKEWRRIICLVNMCYELWDFRMTVGVPWIYSRMSSILALRCALYVYCGNGFEWVWRETRGLGLLKLMRVCDETWVRRMKWNLDNNGNR